MRLSVVSLLWASTLLPCLAAPSAEEILAQSRKALGDVASLKALSLTGVRRVAIQTPEGPGTMQRESEMHFLLPDRFLRSETADLPNGMPGPTIVEGLEGATSWRDIRNAPAHANLVIRTPGAGTGPQSDAEARTRALRNTYLRHVLLYTLAAPPGFEMKFEYAGEAEGEDGRAWVIDAHGPENFSLKLFIDQKTNLLVMASWRGLQAMQVMRRLGPGGPPPAPEPPEVKPKEVEFVARLSEPKKLGGILIPHVMTVTTDGKLAEEYELKSAKVNPNLKPEKFRK